MSERTTPILEIRDLNVFYGQSHALQGVNLTLRSGVLSVVGRNGMGKTTMCQAIMGLVPTASGVISLDGQSLAGRTPAQIARMGVGYVPQGRRLWPSLTVDEHLRLISRRGGAWTIERIYSTFPRLAERRSNGGGQLSGGEQQMLAIGRALLLNPRLLVMDEPTEGLAPVIVSQVQEMLIRLGQEGDIDVLVIEQNIGVACAISDRVAIMVNGRINREMEAATLAGDRDLQQALLGVGRHAHDETPDVPSEAESDETPPANAPLRIYMSNPSPPTRWTPPVPVRVLE
ncbi:MAG: ABC transporter ATP-binding protein, partial [Pseudomonadota bacterium]